MDDETRAELERRLALIEAGGAAEAPLPPLPRADLLVAVVGLASITALLLWWAL